MIVTVGGIKGGSGKSTLATHLAVMHAARGYTTLLLDTDEQGTSSDFTARRAETLDEAGYTCTRQTGKSVLAAARDFSKHYDAVVIDAGGRDNPAQRAALVAADVAVFPFVPGAFDLWTVDQLVGLLDEVRSVNETLTALSYVSRADLRGRMLTPTRELLDAQAIHGLEPSNLVLPQRAAFGAAAATGLTVSEYKPLDLMATDSVARLHGFITGAYLRTPGRKLTHADPSEKAAV